MIAVIRTGGKQYTVREGDILRIEKLDESAEGSSVSFSDVLLVTKEDGSSMKIGMPVAEKAVVEAKVLRTGKARTVLVKKFKAKVRYSRTYGHRQPFTQIQITKISA